jgi:Tol biopolymer transport system component
MPAGGGHIHRLTAPALHGCFPEWTLDGSQILFATLKDLKIWAINADGSGGLEQLTDPGRHNDFFGVASPQGDRIAFARANSDFSKVSVWVRAADGSVTKIRRNASEPAWGSALTPP